ncbi:MAG TPA: aminotransferase class I/II-fold pyridoxal phosphate-dependent enzyme [Candidatus Polarisedimenticolaceae bacterium]|nr:aminotransferase class I/II-fold pyridoxal phosphate-dependent enzyme [Candidatus Polarisedimenticolaceae bacterium]
MPMPISRRAFAGVIGFAAGAALLDKPLVRAATDRRPQREGAIRLDSNENPYGPSAKALAALIAANPIANRYPDDAEETMRSALAKLHGVASEQVVLGCGSSEILQMADLVSTGPGRAAVAAEPTFEAVLHYARVLRADPVTVPLTSDFRHDLPKMAAACRTGAGLVYVCNPNNPTGTIVSGDELAGFVSNVPLGTTILIDEAYFHFVEDQTYRSAIELIPKHPNVVVARTFSKIYGMAGLRLGYAVGAKDRIAEMAKYATFSNANAAVLAAALASLQEPDLVARQRGLLNDTRRWLIAEMSRQGRKTIASHTNFVMIDVGGDVKPVIEAFRERNILVGRKFPSLPNWLRITIGLPDEVKAFAAALLEIVPSKAAA